MVAEPSDPLQTLPVSGLALCQDQTHHRPMVVLACRSQSPPLLRAAAYDVKHFLHNQIRSDHLTLESVQLHFSELDVHKFVMYTPNSGGETGPSSLGIR